MSKKTKTIIIIAVAACAVIAGIVTAIIFREDIKTPLRFRRIFWLVLPLPPVLP